MRAPRRWPSARPLHEGELGPLWVTRASQVYLTLGRMQRDGLVAGRTVPQATRPARQTFELTARGRAAAEAWLAAFDTDGELVVRVAVARLLGLERFTELLDAAGAAGTAGLRRLRALRAEVGGGLQREAVEAEVARVQAELRWLDGVRQRAEEIVAAPAGERRAGGERDARPA